MPAIDESLSKSEEWMRLAFEAAPNGMLVVTSQGELRLVNAEIERMFGYDREELIGKPIEVLIPERFRAGHPDLLQGYVLDPQTRRMGAGRDLFGLRKDGSEFPVEIGLNPIKFDDELFVLGAVTDITERKQLSARLADQARDLRLSEERMRLTFEASPNGLLLVTSQGELRLVNAEIERMFGYDRAELVGQPVEVLIPLRFRIGHPDLLQGFVLDPQTRHMGAGRDLFGLRKDGSEFPVEIGLNPIKFDDELFVLGAVTDITDRKQLTARLAEQARDLSQSEERMRLTFEASPNGLLLVTSQGELRLVNAEIERMFGYDRAELVGQPVEVLIPERFRVGHPEHLQGFVLDPQTRHMGVGRDLFGRRKDGSEFPVEIGLNPIKLDDELFVLGAVTDITDRKQLTARFAEQAHDLRQSEEKMRLTFEASPGGLLLVDSAGEINLVNAQIEQMFGYDRNELLGQPLELLIPERLRAGHPELLQGYVRDPQTRRMGAGRDLFGRRKDGSEFPVEIGLNPIELEAEVFVLAGVLNITERKWAETKISHQAVVLQRSNEELQQFAYVASHDLQEPLRKVASFCALLAEEYDDQLDENGKEYIEFAVDGANRMQTLIQALLTYSRVDSQGKPLATIDPHTSLDMALMNLELSIKESGAAVTYDELPQVVGEETQFAHLLQNLIGNAIKYCDGRTPKIHVTAESGDDAVVFSVADNGIGIDPEFHQRIFGIFKRLHGRGEYTGTGIGLAICKRIVERMGGQIWVESAAGEGSTFYFSVPFHQTSPVYGDAGNPLNFGTID